MRRITKTKIHRALYTHISYYFLYMTTFPLAVESNRIISLPVFVLDFSFNLNTTCVTKSQIRPTRIYIFSNCGKRILVTACVFHDRQYY